MLSLYFDKMCGLKRVLVLVALEIFIPINVSSFGSFNTTTISQKTSSIMLQSFRLDNVNVLVLTCRQLWCVQVIYLSCHDVQYSKAY